MSDMNIGNLVAGLTMDTSGFSRGLATAETGLAGLRKSIDAAKASMIAFLTNPVALAAVAITSLVAVGKAAFDMSEELNASYDYIRKKEQQEKHLTNSRRASTTSSQASLPLCRT